MKKIWINRKGEKMNKKLEKQIEKFEGLKAKEIEKRDAIDKVIAGYDNETLYHGQAIMILQNDYVNNVFNGDIGIIFKENNKVIAYFESDNESPRSIPVQLLPQYETAFAMTIHKSQGSEFDNVIIVLPDFSSQILTTELLYTGITRAKKTLTVIAEPEIIKNTIKKKTDRFSGISHQLEIL